MPLPLSGLLVVSLEQAVAAPMCTCRLADAGARVIKVERPEGDFARYYDRLAVPRARSAPSPTQTPARRGLGTFRFAVSRQARSRLGEGWGGGGRRDAPTLPPTATPTPNPPPPTRGEPSEAVESE